MQQSARTKQYNNVLNIPENLARSRGSNLAHGITSCTSCRLATSLCQTVKRLQCLIASIQQLHYGQPRVDKKCVWVCVFVCPLPLPIFPHDQQAGLPASLAEALGEVSSYGSVAAEGLHARLHRLWETGSLLERTLSFPTGWVIQKFRCCCTILPTAQHKMHIPMAQVALNT